jgi:hypothetical protein
VIAFVHKNVDLKPKRPPSVLMSRGRTEERRVIAMKDELATILEAVRRAQAELAAYLDSADRNAELTIAKLVGILDRREVVAAALLLEPGVARVSSSPIVRPPESDFAKAS